VFLTFCAFVPAMIAVGTGSHLAAFPAEHGDLVFRSRTGGPIWPNTFNGSVWRPLTKHATCTRPDVFWHTCLGCGEHNQLRSRRCARCSLRQRLRELLRDGTGQVHPRPQALHDNKANHERPDTVLVWLNKDTTSAVLHELAAVGRALTTPPWTSCPTPNRSSTCAASWSPPVRCRPATST